MYSLWPGKGKKEEVKKVETPVPADEEEGDIFSSYFLQLMLTMFFQSLSNFELGYHSLKARLGVGFSLEIEDTTNSH